MQKLMSVMGMSICVGLAPLAMAADGIGGAARGAAGGAVSGAGAGGGGAAAAAAASRVRVPGRGPAAAARPVGPNFGAAQAGVRGGVGASVSGPGIGVSGAARANVRAETRGGMATGSSRGESPSQQPSTPGNSNPDGTGPQSHRALVQANLVLNQRLAEVDRLRDVALQSGDAGLLQRTDHLERQARLEHVHRVGHATALQAVAGGAVEGQFPGQGEAERRANGRPAVPFANRPFTDPQTGLTTWLDAETGIWMQAPSAAPAAAAAVRTARREIVGPSQAAAIGLIETPPSQAGAAVTTSTTVEVTQPATDSPAGSEN